MAWLGPPDGGGYKILVNGVEYQPAEGGGWGVPSICHTYLFEIPDEDDREFWNTQRHDDSVLKMVWIFSQLIGVV